jgi:hypothetical protein
MPTAAGLEPPDDTYILCGHCRASGGISTFGKRVVPWSKHNRTKRRAASGHLSVNNGTPYGFSSSYPHATKVQAGEVSSEQSEVV